MSMWKRYRFNTNHEELADVQFDEFPLWANCYFCCTSLPTQGPFDLFGALFYVKDTLRVEARIIDFLLHFHFILFSLPRL